MQHPPSGTIARFEAWLTDGRFIFWLVLLLLLNAFVYFWWMHRPVFKASDGLTVEQRQALEEERLSLEEILRGDCNSPEMQSYPQTGRGAGVGSLADETLLDLLNHASVRILTSNSSGSGFFISKNLVITNRHVIDGAAGKIFVTSQFLGPTPLPAKLVASSSQGRVGDDDFALLQVDSAPSTVRPLLIAHDPKPLQKLIAVGYPGIGIEQDANQLTPNVIFSDGIVSSVQPQPTGVNFVLHTAQIAQGSSGGAAVDLCGNVLGVNTFIKTDANQVNGRSLYALSASSLRKFLDSSGYRYSPASECRASASVPGNGG
jgi:S1-C subfamily serine protease